MPPKRGAAPAAAFEYCELCRRNHDQGRRHRYFPAHRAALAAALSRFRSKLLDLRRALRHPSSAARSRLWCPFCSADLVDLDSRFACSNAIYHLASQDHLNGMKAFLQKHGGGMDQVDSFRISEDELAKWEKCCESSSTEQETSTEGTACQGSSSFGSIPYSAPFETFGVPIIPCGSVALHEQQVMLGTDLFQSAGTKMKGGQLTILGNGPNSSVSCSVHVQQRNSGGNSSQGLKANVHTGAPPPWLEASERDQENESLSGYARPSSRKGKSGKLNPKRVGAAWAERRRAEMEMEKRGELVPETSDSSWLPNFGGVWQSGTRKESRKEFEKNHKPHEEKSNKLSLEMKPYISKRMFC
uniref:TITAN-like protein n=1 Tax=Oryza glumipatula TaxID=40148 RepID=A0A0E0B516_9ORYZ